MHFYTSTDNRYCDIINCERSVRKLAKKVKCEVCGKEFEMTNPEYGCPYCNGNENNDKTVTTNDKNIIASALKIVGVIIVVLSFLLNKDTEVNFIEGLYFFVLHGLYLLGFLSLAEIIQILHDIRNKT